MRQSVAEVLGIVGRHLRRHHRLGRIDHRLDQHRAVDGHRLVEHRLDLVGPLDREARAAHRLRRLGEVDRLQFAAELRIAEKHHLLPGDLVEHVVLDDQQAEGDPVADGGREFAELHRETAIADDREDRPARKGEAGGDRIRKAAGHRSERARDAEGLALAHIDMAGGEFGVLPGIRHQHRVVRQPLSEGAGDALRLHRHLVALL